MALQQWSAERVSRELIRLSHLGLDRSAFWREAAAVLACGVTFDGGCWHTSDPATLLITSHYTNLSGEGFPFICRNEYLQDDVGKFASLAGRKQPVAILSEVTEGRLERSTRYREIYEPRGWGGELRASFDLGGTTWGSVMLLRARGRADFTRAEADVLAAAAPHLAHGIRASLLLAEARGDHGELAPGLLVVDASGGVETMTPAGARWLAELEGGDTPAGQLPAAVVSIAERARRAETDVEGPASVRVRARSGRWVGLHASLLDDRASGRVAVILEPARPAAIAEVVTAAYDLTGREREVLRLVLRGLSTKEVAAALWVTPYTVQDHLKSIFEKTGARSRRELAGRLFYEHFEPHVTAHDKVGRDGWFAERS